MRHRHRFVQLFLVALLAFASVRPAAAIQSGEGEPLSVRTAVTSIWDWLAGWLAPHTDNTRGEIIPDGTTDDPTSSPATSAPDGSQTSTTTSGSQPSV